MASFISGSLPLEVSGLSRRPLRLCLPGSGRNLQQQVRTHHSGPAGAEPRLWIAPVPFLDSRLFHFQRFELQQEWVLLRLSRCAVDQPNGFGFTACAGLARVRLALSFTASLFG